MGAVKFHNLFVQTPLVTLELLESGISSSHEACQFIIPEGT